MTLTPEQAKNIAFKIKALFSKTIDNGATEDEALASIAKARELMDKYSIDFSALDMKAEGVKMEVIRPLDEYARKAAMSMAVGIARYTETKVWASDNRKSINYLGIASDVLFARWLNDSMLAFIERHANVYVEQIRVENRMLRKVTSGAQVRMVKSSFFIGAASRIGTRILNAAIEREKARGALTANALVLVTKKSLITEEMARMGLNLKRGSNGARVSDYGAGMAGQKAGEGARWDKPINDSGKVFQLK